MIVEVCTTSLKSIENAALAGADRVELCAALELGGITPSKGLIQEAVELNLVDVHCLIRPRAGHFTFTQQEVKIIERDIVLAKDLGCKGVVIGALNDRFELDISLLRYWKKLAGNMYTTFHRAIDVVPDPILALSQLVDLGFDCVLSSGQQEKALQGFQKLKLWQAQFGSELLIMPGSGINKNNCDVFKSGNFNAIHLSGSERNTPIKLPEGVNAEISFLKQELSESNYANIKEVVEKVKF